MQVMRTASSGGAQEAEGLGLEAVDGELQPTQLAREEMSAAVDGALELVFAAIADGGAPARTRRILLESLIEILNERLWALERDTGLLTRNGVGRRVAARSLERMAVLTTLRLRAVAMLETDPPSTEQER